VQQQQWILLKAYRDIGSGLNDKRHALLQMLKDVPVFQPDIIVCSYEDRLARFGTTIIKTIFDIFGTKLIFVKKQDTTASLNDQLVTDVIAVITSFAGKLHRRRRGRQNLDPN
jgi:putative resolvase